MAFREEIRAGPHGHQFTLTRTNPGVKVYEILDVNRGYINQSLTRVSRYMESGSGGQTFFCDVQPETPELLLMSRPDSHYAERQYSRNAGANLDSRRDARYTTEFLSDPLWLSGGG